VGPGKLSDQGERLNPDVKSGDTVLYGKYSGTEVTVEGEEYLILRESDILAVIG
jgi:chaperonin GroES